MTQKVNILTDGKTDADTISRAVAGRLKNFRKDKKISLDELSRRTGVSKGMLVELEKGSANPSIAILCKLSAALGVSVADIVNVASEPEVHILMPEQQPTLWRGDKGGTATLLVGTTGPDMIELWRWVMQPGEEFVSPGHPAGTFELFHVTQGALTLTLSGSQTLIKEGSSAVARTDMPHRYANETGEMLIFTMTVAELHR
jgi:transcriptional regulator with XRE-family HTH domain